MKHKTAELEGALLDAAVAKAEGWELIGDVWYAPEKTLAPCPPFYSTHWSGGGPIIERERITTFYAEGEWHATFQRETFAAGPTPLIAAMRAFIAAKLGEEVEL